MYIGGRKTEHLEANLKSLDIALTDVHITKIESVFEFDKGFPHNIIVRLLASLPSSSLGICLLKIGY